jgi:hypothetical protein
LKVKRRFVESKYKDLIGQTFKDKDILYWQE